MMPVYLMVNNLFLVDIHGKYSLKLMFAIMGCGDVIDLVILNLNHIIWIEVNFS